MAELLRVRSRGDSEDAVTDEQFETITKMKGVAEYAEGFDVELIERRYQIAARTNRTVLILRAYNEGGHNCVEIDLIDIVLWIKENRPELIE